MQPTKDYKKEAKISLPKHEILLDRECFTLNFHIIMENPIAVKTTLAREWFSHRLYKVILQFLRSNEMQKSQNVFTKASSNITLIS